MPMKFRSRADIAAEMLEVAKNGEKKTRIMYGSHTSVKQLNTYLDLLIENEMLEYLPEKRIYRTTEKGILFLDSYQKAWGILFRARNKKHLLQHQQDEKGAAAAPVVSSDNSAPIIA